MADVLVWLQIDCAYRRAAKPSLQKTSTFHLLTVPWRICSKMGNVTLDHLALASVAPSHGVLGAMRKIPNSPPDFSWYTRFHWA